jgi:hypothetical protein
MGFIAGGDHNSMGIGVAALWVKNLIEKVFSKPCQIDALCNNRRKDIC